jgi:hypothetical protein
MKRIFGAVMLILILLTACSSGRKSLQDEIVGKWVDNSGFTIEFYNGGTGFIEGVAGSIPDSVFVYKVLDESTIQIDFQGGSYEIDILIDNDKMIWKDDLGEVEYARTP